MILKSIQHGLLSGLLAMFLFSCGAGKNLGTPVGIDFQPEAKAKINYGHSFRIQTFIVYDSGKRKEITGKKDLELTATGANLSGSYVSIDGYPTTFREDSIRITASYIRKELNFQKTKTIPFNYRGELLIKFNGEQGETGANGSDGGTALLFRDGKHGDDGLIGGNGKEGHSLSVHVYKDSLDYYRIRVLNVTTSTMYYYKNRDAGFPIKFSVIGGKGGEGGDGGDGGGGKDGKKTEKKEKRPGDGGDGGNGGDGGAGGVGGSVFIYIHPSAEKFAKKINLVNIGGSAGDGGEPGRGGRAGSALEGQEAATDGTSGAHGNPGVIGLPGSPISVSIEEFDIDF